MDGVLNFTGTNRDSRSVLTCPECGFATFKIVKRGASDVPLVECANCECHMQGIKITHD